MTWEECKQDQSYGGVKVPQCPAIVLPQVRHPKMHYCFRIENNFWPHYTFVVTCSLAPKQFMVQYAENIGGGLFIQEQNPRGLKKPMSN